MRRYLNKSSVRALLIGMVCGAAVWWLARVPLVHGIDEWMFDGWFHLRGAREHKTRIEIVGLDEKSLIALRKPIIYASPELAQVITYLHEQGAKAIGVDMMIAEHYKNMPELQIGGDGDATTVGKAVDDAKNVILAERKAEKKWVEPFELWRPLAEFGDPNYLGRGFVNLSSDDDHFLRRQSLSGKDSDEKSHIPFALALWAKAHGSSIEWVDGQPVVAKKAIPLDADSTLRINFFGRADTFKPVSFSDVLNAAKTGLPLERSFDGAIVIIGATAPSMMDYHATPYANNFWHDATFQDDGMMPGPEIHANIIATIGDEAYITSVPWLTSLPMMVLFGGLMAFGMNFTNRIQNIPLYIAVTFAILLVHHFLWKRFCLEAFKDYSLHIRVLPMLLLGFVIFAANFGERWLAARELVSRIKPLEYVFHGLRDGEQRMVTVLFADIRNFTAYSNSHPGRDVVALLNAYFAEMVPRIRANDGAVCLFMGDGIMAIFGVTDPSANHALQATRAAVEMARKVRELSPLWTKHDCPDFRIGVGVHSGPAILGAVGSADCFDYTVIGHTVNLASRIESANKKCATTILISAETFKELPRLERERLGCNPNPLPIEAAGVADLVRVHEVTIDPVGQVSNLSAAQPLCDNIRESR